MTGRTTRWAFLPLVLLLVACTAPAPAATPITSPTTAPVVTPEPVGGTGVITFGLAFDEETLQIVKPQSSFKRSNKGIAWSASLSEPADATTLTWILAKVSSGGVESILYKQDVDISNPDFDTLANKIDLALLVDRKAGTYVMRYLRENEVLAEGQFKLTK